jgi:hypothetical protein
MKRLLVVLLSALALLGGCATLDEQQRKWIFQPTDRTWWGGAQAAEGMQDVWIEFDAASSGQRVRLHGLWLRPAARRRAVAAVPARRALGRALVSAPHAPHARTGLRGAGHRLPRLRPEHQRTAVGRHGATRTRGCLGWLAAQHPGRPRYVFGHSLGGAIAVRVASEVDDVAGLMVEGSFTSIPDVVSHHEMGLAAGAPADHAALRRRVAHRSRSRPRAGGARQRGPPDPARPRPRPVRARPRPKRFVLVEGGTHHNTNAVGQNDYRRAVADLFGLRTAAR